MSQSSHIDTTPEIQGENEWLEDAELTETPDIVGQDRTNNPQQISETSVVEQLYAGMRLDLVVSRILTDYSRARLKSWIDDGYITLNGAQVKPKTAVFAGDVIALNVTLTPQTLSLPEQMDLDIVYEDDSILVVNKPAGLVVHPGAGNWSGTLVNGLLHYLPSLEELPRAGLVHRIDKETSGLLVVAKTLKAMNSLVTQLQDKSVYRVYDAIVVGDIGRGASINQPIKRHPVDRLKMAVQPGGKPSVTHYKVKERFLNYTWLKVQLETGRTHQIRVHMQHAGFPLAGDPVYGGRLRTGQQVTPELAETLQGFKRQALHARQLGLRHPDTNKGMLFEAPMPTDLANLLEQLQKDRHYWLLKSER